MTRPAQKTAGSGAADTAAPASGRLLRPPDNKITAGAGGRGGRGRHGASGCGGGRSGRHITLNGARRGHWRCWRGAGGRSRRGGCRWFATLQHAVVQGVGAPRKPPLFTGAPTLSAGVSVLLLIGRTSVGAGWLMPAAPHRPDSDGRAGRKSVWRRWYRPSPGRKANRQARR